MTVPDGNVYTSPYHAVKTYEDMKVVSKVDIPDKISFTSPLANSYVAQDSRIGSALLLGDIGARAFNMFDQSTWTNVWSDDLIGSGSSAEYNETAFPIIITNKGAIDERWALVFTSSTNFNIIGESVGNIGTGNITTDTAPMNVLQGVPFWVLDFNGFGAGWGSGKVLRFNTESPNKAIWCARTTLSGNEQGIPPTNLRFSYAVIFSHARCDCHRRSKIHCKQTNSGASAGTLWPPGCGFKSNNRR